MLFENTKHEFLCSIMNSEDEINKTESFNILCDDYLKENIGKPLYEALTYLLLYRPDDPIEFIISKLKSLFFKHHT